MEEISNFFSIFGIFILLNRLYWDRLFVVRYYSLFLICHFVMSVMLSLKNPLPLGPVSVRKSYSYDIFMYYIYILAYLFIYLFFFTCIARTTMYLVYKYIYIIYLFAYIITLNYIIV